MKASKIERTDKIVERLKKLQQEKNYSDRTIANLLQIPVTTYKNLIRSTEKGNGNKTIKSTIIDRLAEIYNCSTDYLICKSDVIDEDYSRRTISHPIIYSKKDEMISEIINYLQENNQMLYNIHFLTCQLPEKYKSQIIPAINTLTDMMKMTSFLGRADSLTPEKFSILENCLIFDDIDYTNALICLSEADSDLSKKRNKSAFKKYLQVIYDTITVSHRIAPLAKQAIVKISALEQGWSNYPAELKGLSKELDQLQYNNFISPDKENIKQTIENYIGNSNKDLSAN